MYTGEDDEETANLFAHRYSGLVLAGASGHGLLRIFLLETCKSRGLSLRRLSFNSGLSPGTVYSIINRKYQPTLYSLNQLADYLEVKREYLWNLSGLIENADTVAGDTRLKSQLARANELPDNIRDHVVAGIEQILALAEKAVSIHNHG